MRVVLDTNILFSALISPHGAPDAIYRAWRSARFELVTSGAQLEEIRRASRYPKLQAVLLLTVAHFRRNLASTVLMVRFCAFVTREEHSEGWACAQGADSDPS